jgi:hypothetical protein
MIGPLTLILASIANASPLDPGQIEVLDGDTIRVGRDLSTCRFRRARNLPSSMPLRA